MEGVFIFFDRYYNFDAQRSASIVFVLRRGMGQRTYGCCGVLAIESTQTSIRILSRSDVDGISPHKGKSGGDILNSAIYIDICRFEVPRVVEIPEKG